MTQSPSTAVSTAPKSRKLVMQMIVGALVGGATTYAVLTAIDGSGFNLDDPSRVVALLAGIVFALMGAFVGLGTAAPGPGARLLNVEDADEIREQRRALGRSSIVMILIGAMMAALALATTSESGGILSTGAAAIIAAACLLAICVLSYVGRNDADELMRSVGVKAAAWGMYASLLLFTVWGSLAHLGLALWISPLGLVSALMLIQLGAIYAACARHGVLRPR